MIMKMDLIQVINTVAPSFVDVQQEVDTLRASFPNKSADELAEIYVSRIRNKYTSIGIASALPSVIPGMGTAVQIAVETGSISADLCLMLRWMGAICYGTALIYDKNIENCFEKEVLNILGIWCGVIVSAKIATERIGSKVAAAQFNRHVSGNILRKINQRVGTTIVTKYGTKRGGIALGKLIPFGVGAAVGGTFNYYTMNAFGKVAKSYYQSESDDTYYILDEAV